MLDVKILDCLCLFYSTFTVHAFYPKCMLHSFLLDVYIFHMSQICLALRDVLVSASDSDSSAAIICVCLCLHGCKSMLLHMMQSMV